MDGTFVFPHFLKYLFWVLPKSEAPFGAGSPSPKPPPHQREKRSVGFQGARGPLAGLGQRPKEFGINGRNGGKIGRVRLSGFANLKKRGAL
ncbi:hypothetical protein D5272_16925 [bacterium D16-76]|nr:hypothetical protein [bacterium D16-76]